MTIPWFQRFSLSYQFSQRKSDSKRRCRAVKVFRNFCLAARAHCFAAIQTRIKVKKRNKSEKTSGTRVAWQCTLWELSLLPLVIRKLLGTLYVIETIQRLFFSLTTGTCSLIKLVLYIIHKKTSKFLPRRVPRSPHVGYGPACRYKRQP